MDSRIIGRNEAGQWAQTVHSSVMGFRVITRSNHLIRIAEDDPVEALVVTTAEREKLVEVRACQQDLSIRNMQDFADLHQAFEDVVQPSFLNREWNDLGRHRLRPVGWAIMRRSEISGQLRDDGLRAVAVVERAPLGRKGTSSQEGVSEVLCKRFL